MTCFDRFKIGNFVSISNVLIILLTGLVFLAKIKNNKKLSFIYFLLGSLLLLSCLSWINSENFEAASRQQVTFLTGLAIAVVIPNICRSEKVFIGCIKWMFYSALLVSSIGLAQFIIWQTTGIILFNHTTSYFSSFQIAKINSLYLSNGVFGYHLIFCAVIGLSIWRKLGNRNFIIRIAIIMTMISLALTFSRGAWSAFLIYLILYALYYIRLKMKRIWLPVQIVFIISILIVLLPAAKFIFNMNPMSTYNRLGLVNSSINSIYNNPFLGSGLGVRIGQYFSDAQYYQITEVLSDLDVRGSKQLDIDFKGDDGRESHNTFLQVGITMGIPALLVYLSILFLIVKYNRMSNMLRINSSFGILTNAVFFGFVTTVFCSSFNSLFLVKQTWIVMGLAIAGAVNFDKQKHISMR